MSSRTPTAVNFSLRDFAHHGSGLRQNRCGWGIAYTQGRDALIVREPQPAAHSEWVDFIAKQSIESRCVIAHVRRATRGASTLENTHPFRRVLGHRLHLFAHNGTLGGIDAYLAGSELSQQALGETDSELAFCILCERIGQRWTASHTPSLEERLDLFTEFCTDMVKLGPSNFLYFDGEILFVHGHRRIWESDGLESPPRPPGLHIKSCAPLAPEHEYHTDGLTVDVEDRRTLLVASVPLDDDGWEPLPEGKILALRYGEVVAESSSH